MTSRILLPLALGTALLTLPAGARTWVNSTGQPLEGDYVDLKEGKNTIRVIFDANKQVAESNENNTYSIKVIVKIDCNGDGKIGGVAVNPNGGLKATPGQGDPAPAKPHRSLRPRG